MWAWCADARAEAGQAGAGGCPVSLTLPAPRVFGHECLCVLSRESVPRPASLSPPGQGAGSGPLIHCLGDLSLGPFKLRDGRALWRGSQELRRPARADGP